jgi:predicted phosphoribosyltransferase
MLAAIRFAKKQAPSTVVVASPAASDTAYLRLSTEAGSDRLVILHQDREQPLSYASFYREYPRLTDEGVVRELTAAVRS